MPLTMFDSPAKAAILCIVTARELQWMPQLVSGCACGQFMSEIDEVFVLFDLSFHLKTGNHGASANRSPEVHAQLVVLFSNYAETAKLDSIQDWQGNILQLIFAVR